MTVESGKRYYQDYSRHQSEKTALDNGISESPADTYVSRSSQFFQYIEHPSLLVVEHKQGLELCGLISTINQRFSSRHGETKGFQTLDIWKYPHTVLDELRTVRCASPIQSILRKRDRKWESAAGGMLYCSTVHDCILEVR